MAPVDILDSTSSSGLIVSTSANTNVTTTNNNDNTTPINTSSIAVTETMPDPAPTPPPPPLLVTTTTTTTPTKTTANKIKLYNKNKLDDNNNDKSSIMVLCTNNNRPKDASASSSSGELDEEEDEEDDEEEVEDSSSSLSNSSLSPLSSFETRVGGEQNLNLLSSGCSSDENTETIKSSNSEEVDSTPVNNNNNNNNRVVKRLESDDLSYASDSVTPTPTPNALNGHDEKFVEFSSTSSSNLNTPTLPPPPNTLPLFTNLNQDTNNIASSTGIENQEEPPCTASSITTTTTSTISADSPEFIPSSLAAVTYPLPSLSHLVYNQARGVLDGEYISYAYTEPSYSYSQTSDSSTLMSPIGDLNPTLANEGIATTVSGVSFQQLPSNLTTPTASSSTIFVHVDAGHIFQVHLGDECKEIVGPATVKIVSNDNTQPFPLQLASPAPGQLVQQILDENGMLTHLIISSQPQYVHAGVGNGMHVQNVTGTISHSHHHQTYHHHQPNESLSTNLIHPSYNPYQNHVQHQTYSQTSPSQVNSSPAFISCNGNVVSPQLNLINPSQHTPQTKTITPPETVNQSPPPLTLSNYTPQYNQYADQGQYYNQYPPLPQTTTATITKTADSQPVNSSTSNLTKETSLETYSTTNTSNLDESEKGKEILTSSNNSEPIIETTQLATIIIDNTTQTGENTSQISSSSSSSSSSSAVVTVSSSATSQNSQSISPSSLSSCSSSTSSASNASSYSILKNKETIQEIDSPSSSSSSSSSLIQHHLQHQQPHYYHNSQHHHNHAHFVSQPFLIYENSQDSPSSGISSSNNKNNKTRFIRLNPNNINNPYYNINSSGVFITNGGQRLKNNNDVKSLLNINRKYPNTVTTTQQTSKNNIPINIENLNYTNTKKPYLNNSNTNNKLPVYNYHSHQLHHTPTPHVYSFNSRPLSTNNNSNRSNIQPSSQPPSTTTTASISYSNSNKILKQKSFNHQNNYSQNYNNNSQYNNYSEFTHNNTVNQYLTNTYQTNYGKNLYHANIIDMDTRLRHRGDDNVSPSSFDYDDINISGVGKTVIYNDSIQIREDTEEMEEDEEEDGEDEEELEEENGEVFNELNKNHEFYISILSNIKEPIVCDIEARSSLVRLSPIEPESFFSNKSLSETKVECCSSPPTNDDSNEDDGLQKVVESVSPNVDLINKILESLNYTLELSSETNKFNKVYSGDANEITLKDLKPNTKYFLRVYASLSSKCKGSCTNVVSFQTMPCQPDPPAPPKLTGLKKKNELTLRWSNSNDNGQKITNFLLEYQEINSKLDNFDVTAHHGEGVEDREEEFERTQGKATREEIQTDYAFISVYKGPLKQFTVKKLNPSTCYAFRIAAENAYGVSEFSKPTLIYTSRSVPSVPEAPFFLDATISTIKLGWGPRRQNEVDYELQLFDSMTSIHGFLTVYNGPQLEYECTNLNKCTLYQFRLRAKNEEGNSAWSETKSFSTKADAPQAPLKLQTRIQNSPILIRVSWDAPKHNGGDNIISYCLELAEFALDPLTNNYSVIYEGEYLEYTIEKCLLNPGAKYSLRVSCANTIGRSFYSETINFVCPCTVPGKCEAPKVFGKPKSNSVQLKWNIPHETGGLPITNYEVSNNGNLVYVGNGSETGCTLNDLLPDKKYTIRMRCLNKLGAGEWSDTLEFTSGAGCPDSPSTLSILAKSANCLCISWLEPMSNGSPITEYRVEWSPKENESFAQLYSGLNLKYELKGGILPSTKYYFRVQAFNANGPSLFSPIVECVTPAAVPAIINSLKIDEIKSDAIGISWKQPNANGDSIIFYNIDISDSNSFPSTIYSPITVYNEKINCEYKLNKLQPDTVYKIRIQAANSIGVGQFSNAIKVKTMASLPAAPHIECVSSSYNSIKLKWTHFNNSNSNVDNSGIVTNASTKSFLADKKIVYNLEMIQFADEKNVHNSEFDLVYNGPLNLFKVTKLQESSSYGFRVSASNETGQGEWSDICKVNTTKSPPIINKAPLVSDLTAHSCQIEWTPAKLQANTSGSNNSRSDETLLIESLEYILQLQKSPNEKSSEYKEVYRGDACSFRLKDLTPNTEYNVRVCSIRILSLKINSSSNDDNTSNNTNMQRIYSPVSPHSSFTTLKLKTTNSITSGRSVADESTIHANASSTNEPKSSKMGGIFMWPSFYFKLNSEPSSSSSSKKLLNKVNEKSELKSSTKNHLSKRNSISRINTSSSELLTSSSSSTAKTNNNNSITKANRKMNDKHWAILLIIFLVMIAFLTAFTVNTIYTSLYEVAPLMSSNDN